MRIYHLLPLLLACLWSCEGLRPSSRVEVSQRALDGDPDSQSSDNTDAGAAPVEAGPTVVDDPELRRLVAALDEDPDRLHVDFTPAVHGLIARGVAGALAVVDLLDAPAPMTRLHARRVVEGVAMRYHGWLPGRGYADGTLGEERVSRLMAENGSTELEGEPALRAEAVGRWRRWLEARLLPADAPSTRGGVDGSFRLERSRVIVGQPLWAELNFENRTGVELRFDVGGDYRGSLFHARYGVVVESSAGERLCDTSRQPPINLGGLGQRAKVAPGGAYRDRILLNPACDAFTAPGRYRVTLTRALTLDDALPSGCDAQSPPDLSSDEAAHPRLDAACLGALRSVPSLTTTMSLEILPYDRARLEETLRGESGEISGGADPGYRTWHFQWLCQRLRCDCAPLSDTSNAGITRWMTSVAEALPTSVRATPCPAR